VGLFIYSLIKDYSFHYQYIYNISPVAARSKASVCVRSVAGIGSLNPSGGLGGLSLVTVVLCQVEITVSGRSLVQRSPTDCGVV